MKRSKVFLIICLFLVPVSCGGSSYIAQDAYLTDKGFAELSNGNYPQAEANLLVALDLNPENPYTLLNLGVVYQDMGRTSEAVEIYERLLELNPEETAVQSNNGDYRGRRLVEIARENLRSLGVVITEKDSAKATVDLAESVVSDSDVKPSIIVHRENLRNLKDTAARHATELGSIEGKQGSVTMALGGSPSGAGAQGIGACGRFSCNFRWRNVRCRLW